MRYFQAADLARFCWIWFDFVGFGWIWLDLAGSGWIWLDLFGFALIWLDLAGSGWAVKGPKVPAVVPSRKLGILEDLAGWPGR